MRNLKHNIGRRQLYIYFWDDTHRIFPDLSVSEVRDLFAEKRAEMYSKSIPKLRESEVQEFIGGNVDQIHRGPSF